jgi:hypothetical protein
LLLQERNYHQRGEGIMSQGVLPFKYEEAKKESGMTALGGLPLYLDLATVMGIGESIEKHLHIKQQGWTDKQIILSLMLLNLAGGDCVDDLQKLEGDGGFCQVLRRVEQKGMKRRERRELDRRWRKDRVRVVPSQSPVFRYLSAFHDPEQEKRRIEGKAFIPAPNEHLRGIMRVNADMLTFIQSRNSHKVATLDQDATLVETTKCDALFSYKGNKAYQPLNTWWAEQGLILHTEFRDGNVPAGYEQLRVLQDALAQLPTGVEKVRLRSDTAGYQHELLQYCAKGKHKRFGRIEFAVGCDVTPEFKDYDGGRIKTNQEWTEVCFIPNAIAHSKDSSVYRYLAIRESIGSMDLPCMESLQQSLPFPTLQMSSQRYKLFGLVTNMNWAGEKLIHWHRERCGKSEEAHSVKKEDLAGGKLPAGDFGENAAWWWIMILSMNLNSAMKRLALGKSWEPRRMKAIRFALINIPGRIVEHTRDFIIRLVKDHPAVDPLIEARKRIRNLIPAPA